MATLVGRPTPQPPGSLPGLLWRPFGCLCPWTFVTLDPAEGSAAGHTAKAYGPHAQPLSAPRSPLYNFCVMASQIHPLIQGTLTYWAGMLAMGSPHGLHGAPATLLYMPPSPPLGVMALRSHSSVLKNYYLNWFQGLNSVLVELGPLILKVGGYPIF